MPVAPGPRRTSRSTIWILATASVLVVAAIAAGVAIIVMSGGGTTATYANPATAFSFSYPAGWIKVTGDNVAELELGDYPRMVQMFNQVMLVGRDKRGDDAVNHYVLGVAAFSSKATGTPQTWETRKKQIAAGAAASAEGLRKRGYSISEPTVTDTKIAGHDAMRTSYGGDSKGIHGTFEQALINGGDYMYFFDYSSFDVGTKGDTGTFEKILDSVKIGE